MTDAPEFTQHESTYAAMIAVMGEIDVIAKSRKTEAQGNYNFRGIEELLEVYGPAARRHGLLSLPGTSGPPIVSSYPTRSGGQMNHVMVPVTVTFRATPDRGDTEVAELWGEAADAGDKAVVKAESVGYREIMFKTFAIPTRGAEYDTEQTTDDIKRASDADVAAQREAAELARVQGRGWADPAERDRCWEDFKAACKLEGPAGDWVRGQVEARSVRKSSYSAALHQEIEEALSHANTSGEWEQDYEPGGG